MKIIDMQAFEAAQYWSRAAVDYTSGSKFDTGNIAWAYAFGYLKLAYGIEP